MGCYKECRSEERVRDQVDFMQLTVSPALDNNADDDSYWNERIDALRSEVLHSISHHISYLIDWIEQGLTSHQTHYRSYRGRVSMGQMTQPTVSKH